MTSEASLSIIIDFQQNILRPLPTCIPTFNKVIITPEQSWPEGVFSLEVNPFQLWRAEFMKKFSLILGLNLPSCYFHRLALPLHYGAIKNRANPLSNMTVTVTPFQIGNRSRCKKRFEQLSPSWLSSSRSTRQQIEAGVQPSTPGVTRPLQGAGGTATSLRTITSIYTEDNNNKKVK